MRVRGFHQDDAHLFVREDQIEDEIASVLELVDTIYCDAGTAVLDQAVDAARGVPRRDRDMESG